MINRIKYAAIIITAVIILPTIIGKIESHYTREATVVGIDIQNSKVIVVDSTGHEWSFVGTNYKVSDKVVMSMNTNHTDNTVNDDAIESVKIVVTQ